MTALAETSTASEFKRAFHEGLRDLGTELFIRYGQELLTTEDLPEIRRGMEFITNTLALAEEKKQEVNSNLPVLQFNFISNGAPVPMTITAVDPQTGAELQTIEFNPEPSAAMRANLAVNRDITHEVIDC